MLKFPGPGSYNMRNSRLKILGLYTTNEPKSSFLMDAEYNGMMSPSSLKYNLNYDSVEPRSQTVRISKPSKSAEKGRNIFPKSIAPPPGHYKADESFVKT